MKAMIREPTPAIVPMRAIMPPDRLPTLFPLFPLLLLDAVPDAEGEDSGVTADVEVVCTGAACKIDVEGLLCETLVGELDWTAELSPRLKNSLSEYTIGVALSSQAATIVFHTSLTSEGSPLCKHIAVLSMKCPPLVQRQELIYCVVTPSRAQPLASAALFRHSCDSGG